MKKINRESQHTMEYVIYLYLWLCYCGSMLLPSTARKYFSIYCLLRKKISLVFTESAWILHHVSSQKYLKLNYHNLENICVKMLLLRQMKLCQISSGFLQKLWTSFHALVFVIYNCSRPKAFLIRYKSEHITSWLLQDTFITMPPKPISITLL